MYTGLQGIQESLADLMETDTPVAQQLHRAEAILAEHGLSVQTKLRRGVVADEILQEARAGAFNLIVLGASTIAGQLRHWLLGEVT